MRPAAAAMAAKLALVGIWAAPWRAADSPEAVTITCPVPKVEGTGVAACVMMVWDETTGLLSVDVD